MNFNITSEYKDNSVDFEKKFINFFYKTVLEAQGDARRYAPVDLGNLRRQIIINWISPFKAQLISNANYSACVEFGTSPHIIKPKNKKVLHWKSGGKDVFSMKVNHPGTNAQPFMRPAKDLAEYKIKKFLL